METVKDKLSDNELIAKFMGETVRSDGKIALKDGEPLTGNCIVTAKYSTSWDWLMPVVEKIESLGPSFIIKKSEVNVYGWTKMVFGVAEKNQIYEYYDINGSKIEAVYKAVVEFIKWYNTQTPSPNE